MFKAYVQILKFNFCILSDVFVTSLNCYCYTSLTEMLPVWDMPCASSLACAMFIIWRVCGGFVEAKFIYHLLKEAYCKSLRLLSVVSALQLDP